MLEHKLLFSLVVLASLMSFGWVLTIYVLSFHAARWLIDTSSGGYPPRRPELRFAQCPAPRHRPIRMG